MWRERRCIFLFHVEELVSSVPELNTFFFFFTLRIEVRHQRVGPAGHEGAPAGHLRSVGAPQIKAPAVDGRRRRRRRLYAVHIRRCYLNQSRKKNKNFLKTYNMIHLKQNLHSKMSFFSTIFLKICNECVHHIVIDDDRIIVYFDKKMYLQ